MIPLILIKLGYNYVDEEENEVKHIYWEWLQTCVKLNDKFIKFNLKINWPCAKKSKSYYSRFKKKLN